MADESKQEPEKPGKNKSGGSIPLFGLIGFAIVLIALVVNLFLLLGVKSQVASMSEVIMTGGISSGKEHTTDKKSEDAPHEEETEQGSSSQFVADEEAQYFETGRITTNPRQSSNFVVMNLGLFYKLKNTGEEEAPPAEEGAKEKDTFSPFGKKFDGMLRNLVNSQIGSMSIEEMQIPRDSMSKMFLMKLKPLFSQKKTTLKEVAIVEFIIQ